MTARIEDGGPAEAGLVERLANGGHTPGPWFWHGAYMGLFGSGPSNEVLHYAPYEGMWVNEWNERGVANASLIAAAPELLDIAIQQAAEITRLRAENAGMLEALKPFAFERSSLDLSHYDDENQIEVRYPPVGRHQRIPVGRIVVGDVRRARAAISRARQMDLTVGRANNG